MEEIENQSVGVEVYGKTSAVQTTAQTAVQPIVQKQKIADLTVFNHSSSEDEDSDIEDCLKDKLNKKMHEKTYQKKDTDSRETSNKRGIEGQIKPAFYVPVHRSKDISVARMSLPVVGEEQTIMETIMENDVTVLCSETGSGKTTQLPQFLYEAGFGHPDHLLFSGMIGITQPRRVAAVSMAARVSHEMNLFNGQVSYQIRYDKGNLNKNTRILFMTDGILLRQLSQRGNSSESSGLLLPEYSCIIIDEAHERTVGTDILLGWLTRVVKLRNSGRIVGIKPLKLVIMSATLRVEDFTENKALFPESPPPVINVPGSQHKVVVHYNRHTQSDYVSEAFRKAVKIHTRFPPGGILIFVTGQQEVHILLRKLRKEFCPKEITDDPSDSKTDDVGGLSLLEENQGESDDDYDPDNSSDIIDSESMISEEDSVKILNGTIEDEDIEMLTEMSESEIKTRGILTNYLNYRSYACSPIILFTFKGSTTSSI